MIGTLRGAVIDRDVTEITVEVAGVGYRVTVTPALAAGIGVNNNGSEPHQSHLVWIHHHLREDAQTLYGFASRDERDVFEVLIGTHGVGPALAMAILGVHAPAGLRLAVATDDVAALCLVPGVGRKTAARLLMELSSRLVGGEIDLTTTGTTTDDGSAPSRTSPQADVREALVGLGYGTDEVAAVVRELPSDGDSAALLKLALQKLATSF